jgi:UDP-N-acetylmuramate-alanine ligase
MRIHADPDPGQTLTSIKIEFLHGKLYFMMVPNRYWATKHAYVGTVPVLFERANIIVLYKVYGTGTEKKSLFKLRI